MVTFGAATAEDRPPFVDEGVLSMSYTRRGFLAGLGASAAVVSVPVCAVDALAGPSLLYPPADLSYFDAPLHRGPMKIQIGYAAITWKENDNQAIEDIAAVGYPGIQLRANVLGEYPDPHALKDTLAKHNLTFVALSMRGICTRPAESICRLSVPSPRKHIPRTTTNAKECC